MTEQLYVITADIVNREQDGQDPQDGSPLHKSFATTETWAHPASATLGDIMKTIRDYSGEVVRVTVTTDQVSAKKIHEERLAARRERNDD